MTDRRCPICGSDLSGRRADARYCGGRCGLRLLDSDGFTQAQGPMAGENVEERLERPP